MESLRARRRSALHLAPPRGDLRALPASDGAARRALGAEPSAGRAHRRRSRAGNGRPRHRRTRDGTTEAVGDVVLQVERLSREGFFTDVSFEVKAGEIVALAGLVGSGRSEVACSIFGIDRYDAGSVTVNGRELRRASPTAAMSAGVGLVPGGSPPAGARDGDRRSRGTSRSRRSGGCSASGSSSRRRSAASLPTGRSGSSSSTGGSANAANSLSGGNQQKVVLAKWLGRRAVAPDRRRADARHRHRHEGGGAPTARRARRPGRGDPDDLVRASRGARASPTGSSSCARAGSSPSSRTPKPVRGDDRGRGDGAARGGSLMATVDHASLRSGRPNPLRSADRHRLPAAGLRDRGRAHAARDRDLDGPAALPQRPGGQHRPRELPSILALLTLGEAMVDHHAQRRPLGRLRARPLRLRLGEHVRPSPRDVDRSGDPRLVPRRHRCRRSSAASSTAR